ncbi:MAG TPA: helix-turn-helix domain-containing protein, partial [Planctomycetaceae bacterium]|nr:helix-turn-helix domain-containing protein [Planctomycetaceae bacterium]
MKFVAVNLRMSGLATQEEIAQAFGHSVITQRRWEKRFQEDGLDGLGKKTRGRPRTVPETCDTMLRKWFSEGVSNIEMARRLMVSEATIHRALARLGLHRRRAVSDPLPWPDESDGKEASPNGQSADGNATEEESHSPHESGSSANVDRVKTGVDVVDEGGCEGAPEETSSELLPDVAVSEFTVDRDPDDRSGDRAMARVGQLDDATPLFGNRQTLRQVGVLMAVPLLVQSGLLGTFSTVYHSLSPAFYGLRTMVVILFLSALLRIKRPEHFKEYNPQELGHLFGLDRAPEVKTVRRKLTELAGRNRARELMFAVAQRRIDDDPDRVAFLYIDGHVREYYG